MPLSPSIRYQVDFSPAASSSNHDSPPPLIRLKLSQVEQQNLLKTISASNQSLSIQLAGSNSAIHLGSDSSSSIPLQLVVQHSTRSTELHRLDSNDSLQSIGTIHHSLLPLSSVASSTASTSLSHQELASKLRKRREEDEARKKDKAAVLLDPEEQRRLQSTKNKTSTKGTSKHVAKSSPIRKSTSSISREAKARSGNGSSSNLLSVGSSSSIRGSSPTTTSPLSKPSSSKTDTVTDSEKDVVSSLNTTLRRKMIQTLASSPLKRKYLASHLECSAENQILPILDLVAEPVDSQDDKGKAKASSALSEGSGGTAETLYKLRDELFTQVYFSKESWSDYSSAQRKSASFNAELAFKRMALDQNSEIGRPIWNRLWPEGGREEWIAEHNAKIDGARSSLSGSIPGINKIVDRNPREEQEEESLEEGEEREINEPQPHFKPLPRIKKVSDRPGEEVSESDAAENRRKIKSNAASGSTHERLRKATKTRNSSSSARNTPVTASSKAQEPDKLTKSSGFSASHPIIEPMNLPSITSNTNKRSRKLSRSVSPPSWIANTKSKKSSQPDSISSKKLSAGDHDDKPRHSDSSISVSTTKRKTSTRKSEVGGSVGKKKGKKLVPRNLDYTDSEDEGGNSSKSQIRSEGSIKPNKRIKSEHSKPNINAISASSSKTKAGDKVEDEVRKSSKNLVSGAIERGRTKEKFDHQKPKPEEHASFRSSFYSNHTTERSRSYSRSISFDSREGSFSSLDDDDDSSDSRFSKMRRSISRNDSSNSFDESSRDPKTKSRSTSRNSLSGLNSENRRPLDSELKSSISPSINSSIVSLRPPGPGVSIQSSGNGNEPPWLSINSSSDYTRLVERFLKSFQDYKILKARCEKEREMLLMEEGMLEVENEREIREMNPFSSSSSSSSAIGSEMIAARDRGELEETIEGDGDFVKIEDQETSSRTDVGGEDVEMKDQESQGKRSDNLRISTNLSKEESAKTSSIHHKNPPSSPEEGEATPQVDDSESRFTSQYQSIPTSHSNSTITAADENQERSTTTKKTQDEDSILETERGKDEETSKSRSQSPQTVWRVVPPLIESNTRRHHHSSHFDHFSNQELQSRPMGFNELKELVQNTKELFGRLKRMRETLLEHKAKSLKVELGA